MAPQAMAEDQGIYMDMCMAVLLKEHILTAVVFSM